MLRTTTSGVVGSTLAFESIGRGFESEHHLISHHRASAFSKLSYLPKCSLDDSVRWLLWFTQLVIPSGEGESSRSVPVVVLRGLHRGAGKRLCLFTGSSFPIAM